MNQPDFIWEDWNEAKVAAHGVTPTEAEDALLDLHRLAVRAARRADDPRRRAIIGMTEAGRIVVVVSTKWSIPQVQAIRAQSRQGRSRVRSCPFHAGSVPQERGS